MLKLLADENFDNTIIRGLLRRNSKVDIVRVQDAELSGKDDLIVLAWAAQENRVLLTHDVATITKYAYERVAKGYHAGSDRSSDRCTRRSDNRRYMPDSGMYRHRRIRRSNSLSSSLKIYRAVSTV